METYLPPSQPTKSKTIKDNTRKIVLPCINYVGEITETLFKHPGIDVTHKPTKSLPSSLCQPKDLTVKEDKTNIIYKINSNDCENTSLATRVDALFVCIPMNIN